MVCFFFIYFYTNHIHLFMFLESWFQSQSRKSIELNPPKTNEKKMSNGKRKDPLARPSPVPCDDHWDNESNSAPSRFGSPLSGFFGIKQSASPTDALSTIAEQSTEPTLRPTSAPVASPSQAMTFSTNVVRSTTAPIAPSSQTMTFSTNFGTEFDYIDEAKDYANHRDSESSSVNDDNSSNSSGRSTTIAIAIDIDSDSDSVCGLSCESSDEGVTVAMAKYMYRTSKEEKSLTPQTVPISVEEIVFESESSVSSDEHKIAQELIPISGDQIVLHTEEALEEQKIAHLLDQTSPSPHSTHSSNAHLLNRESPSPHSTNSSASAQQKLSLIFMNNSNLQFDCERLLDMRTSVQDCRVHFEGTTLSSVDAYKVDFGKGTEEHTITYYETKDGDEHICLIGHVDNTAEVETIAQEFKDHCPIYDTPKKLQLIIGNDFEFVDGSYYSARVMKCKLDIIKSRVRINSIGCVICEIVTDNMTVIKYILEAVVDSSASSITTPVPQSGPPGFSVAQFTVSQLLSRSPEMGTVSQLHFHDIVAISAELTDMVVEEEEGEQEDTPMSGQ